MNDTHMSFVGRYEFADQETLEAAMAAFDEGPIPGGALTRDGLATSLSFRHETDVPAEWTNLLMQVVGLSETADRGSVLAIYDRPSASEASGRKLQKVAIGAGADLADAEEPRLMAAPSRLHHPLARTGSGFSSCLASLVLSSVVAACATPPPATPSTPREGPAADEDAKVGDAGSSEEKAAPKKAGGKAGMTEAKLRASKSLSEAFPEIEAVTKELGAPMAQGKTTRLAWYFEKKKLGTTMSCDTIDLIKGPGDRTVVDTSAYTGKACESIKLTKANVIEVLAKLAGTTAPKDAVVDIQVRDVAGKPFATTSAAFEKKAGKPQLSGQPDFAAWKYESEDEGACRLVIVTSHLGSGAGQAIWDQPCE